MHRFISQHHERRTPSEDLALAVWLGHRSNVFRRALLECSEPPNLELQIEAVDRIMLEVFNAAAANHSMHDIAYLMDRATAMLKLEWVSRSFLPSLERSGGQPIPIHSVPACRKVMTYSVLR